MYARFGTSGAATRYVALRSKKGLSGIHIGTGKVPVVRVFFGDTVERTMLFRHLKLTNGIQLDSQPWSGLSSLDADPPALATLLPEYPCGSLRDRLE